jgi:heparan-alpha-glucosaminide N-acetyltransferase
MMGAVSPKARQPFHALMVPRFMDYAEKPARDHDFDASSRQVAARLGSVDAYRGLVMFLMMAEVLHLKGMADAHSGSEFWEALAWHQHHVEWVGCTLHDMIQPSFSFLVGVALPFSIASRLGRGQTPVGMTLHALWRAFLLVALGIFLRSMNAPITRFTFEDTLSQIGLGYPFLFLLGFRPRRDQWIALGLILVGYWAAFALYSPGSEFAYADVGVPASFTELATGFGSHWNKNGNLAWRFDVWFLNLFPQRTPFRFNGGGYATLSFIPTLATMILGLLAGGILRSDRPNLGKVAWLLVAGAIGVAVGWSLGWLGVCPVVKRIWTPSWVLFSGGLCFLFMAAFNQVVDLFRLRPFFFPLIVIGMNSIAAYSMAHLVEPFLKSSMKTHGWLVMNPLTWVWKALFQEDFARSIAGSEVFLQGLCVLMAYWLILFWMYRRKIFLRI